MNRFSFIILCFLIPYSVSAQFTDDFSDGDFTNSPAWTGDTAMFRVDPANMLQLYDTAVAQSISYLSTPSVAINNAEWEFYVQMDFNPSSNNYARVYLTADEDSLSGSLNGYFVMLGNTSDEVSLYVQSGTSTTKIIDGTDGRLSSSQVTVRVKATRDSVGNWELYSDTLGGTSYFLEGSVTENTHDKSEFFGVFCDYTSTRSDKFFYDDFIVTGDPFLDTIPPLINSIQTVSSTAIAVLFDEPLEQIEAETPINYSIDNGIGSPGSALLDGNDPSMVHLTFGTPLSSGTTYTLTVVNVQDTLGNAISTETKTFTYFGQGPASFTDDFSDGDFINNPSWSGEDTKFDVNADYTLQLDAPAVNDVAYLSTPFTPLDNSEWEFHVAFDFNPSGSNYAKVYLTSDQPNLKDPLNGYYVMVGNTNREISLYEQSGTGTTKIIDGKNDRINASQIAVRIKVTRDSTGYWKLFSDTLAGRDYYQEGSVTDSTHNTSYFFGVLCNYTSTRSDKFFYDDFFIGTAWQDTVPPVIESVSAVSSTELEVMFEEEVELNSAETSSNYSVNNGIGNPITAVRDPADSLLVHLTFGTAFTEGVNYTLTVNNVEDTSGNAISGGTGTFLWFVPVPADFKDIVINEIFPNTMPQVGLPVAEFVELYNVSSKVFDLAGWTYSDESKTVGLDSYILKPGDHLILCPENDTVSYNGYGQVMGLSSWPILNISGDYLSLADSSGNLVDWVEYEQSWYQDNTKEDGGWTLELINPTHPCTGAENWRASVHPDGGTPGAQNSIMDISPDITPPEVTAIQINNQTEVEVWFSEGMDSLSLINANYTINNGITVSGVQAIGPSYLHVILSFTAPLDSATAYTLIVSDATDCSGNLLADLPLLFGIGVDAAPFDMVINEIFPAPDPDITALPDAQFVELYNKTDKVLHLNGYVFSDPSSSKTIGGEVIFPKEHLILCGEKDQEIYEEYGRAITVSSLPVLNKTSDDLRLENAAGMIIHAISYEDSWYGDDEKKNGGWSLEMIDPLNPCGEADNWKASNDPSGGTPGKQNSVFGPNPDEQGPDLLKANALDSVNVLLTFDQILDTASVINAIYAIDQGIAVSSVKAESQKTVLLTLSVPLKIRTIYTITVIGLYDCVGNLIPPGTSVEFVLPEPGEPGDLIINEVLFNPRTGGSDFVEIYNNSQKNVNLQNWMLANYDSNKDTIANFKEVTSTPYVLFPGSYVTLTKDTANIKEEYPLSKSETFIQMASLPSYTNKEGSVILINNYNEVIERFDYYEDMHFALLDDVKGVSLERIDFDRAADELTNWHSASESIGFATPGYQNSQFQPAESAEGTVTVEPEVFSPDNDGIDDLLHISYEFQEPGFVANIVIFDSRGRLVKNLVRNELLGVKGTYSWDGTNEARERERIGIFVIYFEAFNLEGKMLRFKKPCVLAGKL